jgi:hypothetical protein
MRSEMDMDLRDEKPSTESGPDLREEERERARERELHANRDPITGEAGSHPVGTGIGAVGGAVAGAAIGAVGGPIGAAVGGVIGAIAGGAAGHGIAESIDPTAEEAYWRENYHHEPYHSEEYGFSDYEPAFRLGYLNYPTQMGRSYEEVEEEFGSDWERTHRGDSRLSWEDAKPAARAAWHRVARNHWETGADRRGGAERVEDGTLGGTLGETDDFDDEVNIDDGERGRFR